MKKTILILTLMFLLVISFVIAAENAVPTDATNLVSLLLYDETSGNINDTLAYSTFTKIAQANDVTYRAKAVKGYGLNWTSKTVAGAYFTGSSDYRAITSTNDYSIFAIVQLNNTVGGAASQCIFDNAAEGADLGIHWCFDSALDWSVWGGGSQSGTYSSADGATRLKNFGWTTIGLIINSSGITGVINGSRDAGDTSFTTSSAAAATSYFHTHYGAPNSARQPFGIVAEMAICQPACSTEQMKDWTDTFFAGDDIPDTTPPVITFVYPEQNVHYNDYDGWLNFTTDENSNCSVNDTLWVKNSSISTATDYYFENTIPNLSAGNQTLNINCWDALDNNGSSILTFAIDTTPPSLISSLQNNNTIAIGTLNFQNNYSDETKLFSVNITGQEYNYYKNNINTTTYSFNGTMNLENYSVGIHYLNTTFCDSHTSTEIGVYDHSVFPITDKLTFSFDKDEYSIQPKDWTHFGGVEVEKLKDRYTFDFQRDKGYETTEEIFIVKSTNKINIVGDDKYTGWLIIDGINKWIDFETEEGHKATIKKINDYEVEVTSKGSLFESTGDLNCVNKTFEFYNFDYSVTYNATISETETTTFLLIVNKTAINITSYDA
ncbi:MAG: hypothetical protein KJ847_02450, partial [Firmicutes bacterium]|nr:hypothetical protein [Bacillota bacterium]